VKRDGAALAFAMTAPAVMAWLYFVELAGRGEGANPALQAAFAVGKVVQFGFPLLYVWLVEPGGIRVAGPNRRGVAYGLGFGLFVGAGILALYHLVLRGPLAAVGTPQRVQAKVTEFGLNSPGGFILLGSFIAVLHSLLEEYYWRWFVFGRLRRYLPFPAAAVISSLAFMAHHVVVLGVYLPGQFWTAAVPFSLCVACGGAVWAWLYERTGSLYGPWLSHVVIDAAIMAVGYDMMARSWG
jgi:membrane protease YdiL (CAAX protease family)